MIYEKRFTFSSPLDKSHQLKLFIFHIINHWVMVECKPKNNKTSRSVSLFKSEWFSCLRFFLFFSSASIFMSWEDMPHAVFNCTRFLTFREWAKDREEVVIFSPLVKRQIGTHDYLIRLSIHSLVSIRFILHQGWPITRRNSIQHVTINGFPSAWTFLDYFKKPPTELTNWSD